MIEILKHKLLTDYDSITFTLFNEDPFEKIIPLFGQNYVYSFPIPVYFFKMDEVLSPSEYRLYSEFLKELERSPKRIYGIRIMTNDFNQLTETLNWHWGDATGSQATNPDHPLSYLDIEQFATTLIDMIKLNRILTSSIYCQYKLLANSSINVTIYYEEFNLTEML